MARILESQGLFILVIIRLSVSFDCTWILPDTFVRLAMRTGMNFYKVLAIASLTIALPAVSNGTQRL